MTLENYNYVVVWIKRASRQLWTSTKRMRDFSQNVRVSCAKTFFFFKERRALHTLRMYENCIRQVSGQPQWSLLIANRRRQARSRAHTCVYAYDHRACKIKWHSRRSRGIPYRAPCWPRLSSLSVFLFLSLAYLAPDCSVLLRSRHRTRSRPSSLPTSFTLRQKSFGCRQCRSSASSRSFREARSPIYFAILRKITSAFPDEDQRGLERILRIESRKRRKREEDYSCKRQRQLENCRGNFICGLISKGSLSFLN